MAHNLPPPPLPFNLLPPHPPGRYNLQGTMDDHEIVGQAVVNSTVGWLNAAEIETILLAAEANLIPVSTEFAPNGTLGLFVYRCRAYNDHREYTHVGPASLILRRPLVHGESSVNMGEAIGIDDNRYRKRIHRRFERFGNLAVVHYRIIGIQEL